MSMTELSIDGVTKVYARGARKVTALSGLSMRIQSDEVTCILGLNGAGKTTLVKILAGLIDPDAGTVHLNNELTPDRAAYRKHVGAVFEGNRNIYWRMTAFENLEYFGVLRGLSRRLAGLSARELLEKFRLTDKSKTVAMHLSRGMQQRLAIAISMIHSPKVLILDEPTLGVDIENVFEIVSMLKLLSKAGAAIVVTSHQFDVIDMVADRVAVLWDGVLLTSKTKEDFLSSGSGDVYILELLHELKPTEEGGLASLGITPEEGVLKFGSHLLYSVLDVLRPTQIGALRRHNDDVARAFLHFVDLAKDGKYV